MMTFRMLSGGDFPIPAITGWYLSDLGEAIGKQELFTRQSPQRLKVLREHALIESAVSSNRIEGVSIEPSRIGTVIFGKPVLRDRDEEEVKGYRTALDLIHREGRALPVSEETIKALHRMARGEIWDAGKYKERTEPIVERLPDGRSHVRFMPVEAGEPTTRAMGELVDLSSRSIRARRIHPLIAAAAFNLDFLCVHPFRDGNGRASRLLFLLHTYHAGVEAGRYVSLERLIEENKERYYETVHQSTQGWHEGRHDPWPFINFLLWILKQAYTEFEARVGEVPEAKGAKAALVRRSIEGLPQPFRFADALAACPGVSPDWVRKVMREMQKEGALSCQGKGLGALWSRRP